VECHSAAQLITRPFSTRRRGVGAGILLDNGPVPRRAEFQRGRWRALYTMWTAWRDMYVASSGEWLLRIGLMIAFALLGDAAVTKGGALVEPPPCAVLRAAMLHFPRAMV
jgi:hypothetical protein